MESLRQSSIAGIMPECQDSNEYYRRFVLSESISRQTYIHIKMKCLGACCPIAEVTDQATPLSEMRCMLCLWHSDVNHAAGKSRNLANFRQKRMHGESALSLAASSAAGTSSPHLMLISPGLMLRLSMCSTQYDPQPVRCPASAANAPDHKRSASLPSMRTFCS